MTPPVASCACLAALVVLLLCADSVAAIRGHRGSGRWDDHDDDDHHHGHQTHFCRSRSGLRNATVTTVYDAGSTYNRAQDHVFYQGFVYVSDIFGGVVFRYNPSTGVASDFVGHYTAVRSNTEGVGAAAQFKFAAGLALHEAAGVIFVTSYGAVMRVTVSTADVKLHAGQANTVGRLDGDGSVAKLRTATGIWVISSQGDLLVTEEDNHDVRNVSAGSAGICGLPATRWVHTVVGDGTAGELDGVGTAAQLNYPQYFAWYAPTQTAYIAEFGSGSIRKLNLRRRDQPTLSTLFVGDPERLGATSVGLVPCRHSSTADPTVYVAFATDDYYLAHFIAKLSPTGSNYTVFVGTPGGFGDEDGVGAAASFGDISGVLRLYGRGLLFADGFYTTSLRSTGKLSFV